MKTSKRQIKKYLRKTVSQLLPNAGVHVTCKKGYWTVNVWQRGVRRILLTTTCYAPYGYRTIFVDIVYWVRTHENCRCMYRDSTNEYYNDRPTAADFDSVVDAIQKRPGYFS